MKSSGLILGILAGVVPVWLAIALANRIPEHQRAIRRAIRSYKKQGNLLVMNTAQA